MAKRALCIGINDYPGTQSDLAGCVNDAHDWADVLGTKDFDVNMLLNARATRASMLQAIGSLISASDPDDLLTITYSGHGTWVPDATGDEPDGRDEGLCPYDIQTSGPLLDDDIHGLFLGRKERVRIVLLSDSCHSGSVTRGDESDLDDQQPRARFLPPEAWMPAEQLPRRHFRPQFLRGGFTRVGGDLLLAGCQDTEYSWDTRFQGRPNGAFTYYALKTLKMLTRGDSYDSWYRRIRDYLPSTRLPQTPQVLGTAQMRQCPIFG